MKLVKKEDGKNYFYYYDNTFEKLEKLTKIYVDSVHEIAENSDVKNLDKETSEKFEKYLKLTSELQLLTEGTEC
ncbi:hypothetical protein BW731_02135 [Vagococcus martis]|uniref:Uncharacterized protein n=1 Tax=Vagococcus martis TaxID=1768210 RepID=A0A1V4DF18_9ENTE|nr:hypothetical protein [Vagococcus martis]OPF87087.1 hypothetical protein BW731_02135 [Vagococcus martis]